MNALVIIWCEMDERAAVLFNHRFCRCNNLAIVAYFCI